MTKKEIYEQVVRLTNELAQTRIAQKIFSAASEKNAAKVNMIINSFPYYYPDLYQKIINFGEAFNKLVGDTAENNAQFNEIMTQCMNLMYDLAQTKVIGQIAEVADTEDASKLFEVINNFKHEYSHFAKKLVKFQTEYSEYRDTLVTGCEGQIFGTEADAENGVFVFDTNVIDALSFYVLIILANISEIYFFYDEENKENDETYTIPAGDQFMDAIKKATNEAFAEFVANYNIVDWIGKDKAFQTVGELLVVVLADEFEE